MWGDAKGLGGRRGSRVIQLASAGPFARPPVTRSEAVETLPGACASEGGLSGPALVFFALLLSGLLGCAGGIAKVVHPPKEPLELTSAFVYPFGFRWEEPTYRRFELSQRLIDAAIHHAGDRIAFFGPSEFKVLRASDDAAWVSSTALPVLLASGQRLDQGVIIRPWAEKRSNSSTQQTYDQKGKAKGTASLEETLYLGHIEIIHPTSGQLLVEVSGEAKFDPFSSEQSPDDEFDPARPLTVLMAKLMRVAVESLRQLAPSRAASEELELTVALTPKATLNYQEDNRPSVELELAKLDPIAAELFVQNRAKFLAPFLSDADAGKVAKMPVGLYVAAAPTGAKVSPGDLLLTIDAEPALPQRLARLRFAHTPVQVRVRKASGEETEVLLP
jgi:hypothetical protein